MSKENIARRPLKSRETKWARSLSESLLEMGFKPNQISVASIIFAILAGIFFLQVKTCPEIWMKITFYILAAVCIQLRLLCNLLDGMMAIEGGLRTKWGDILNDLPDRISDSIILICAGYSISKIPYGSYLGWLAAVIAIMTAYIRVLGGSLGATQYFCGPMAKQHRMATLTIGCIASCVALFFGTEDHLIAISLLLIITGSIVTSIRRILKIVNELHLN